MLKKKTIAVIPARGGSKRIPKKNTIDFFGKPLIAWTIEAAQKSGIFDRILVSTDDPQAAAIAKGCGLDVPFLREGATDDVTPISVATLVALGQVEKNLNETYETVVQLMANCPLRGSEEIVSSYENFKKSGSDFQVSCFPFGWMNPWWASHLPDGKHPSPLFPDALKQRSQDLPPLYCPTGAIWIANTGALKKAGTFYGPGHIFFPMDWKAAVDIDDEDDLEMAKAVFLVEQEKQKALK